MFCSHCGKELSDEAFMCPNCGEPTANKRRSSQVVRSEPEPEQEIAADKKVKALAAVVLTLSAIAFVTGVIFGAFLYVFQYAALLLYIISATTIVPALIGLLAGIYMLNSGACKNSGIAKPSAITAVVLNSVVLLFLFITACILVSML